jgi:V-type H+-transporting ATPase subunit H
MTETSNVRVHPQDLDATTRQNEATTEFQAKTIELRRQKPQWITYYQGQMIDKADYEFIARFDSLASNERERLLSDPNQQVECIRTLMTIMHKVSKEATLQYTVTLMDDILQDNKKNVELFHLYGKKYKENVFQTFIKMLYMQDTFLTHQVSRIITKLACWSSELIPDKELRDYILWAKDQFATEKNQYKDTLCRCLQMLFRIDHYRLAFYKLDGVARLVKFLDGTLSSVTTKDQMQYQVVCCLWLLTFNDQIATRIQSNYMLIPVLADILNATEKEKVKRIILATLRNLLEKTTSIDVVKANCLCMLQSKVRKLLELMQISQIEDPDIVEDIEFLIKKLETLMIDVSSFDEYMLEVTSNRLSWSPAHKSDKFWRENAQKLNENNFFIIRKLIEILKNQQSTPLVLEIALNDLGEYVRYYHRGKKYFCYQFFCLKYNFIKNFFFSLFSKYY